MTYTLSDLWIFIDCFLFLRSLRECKIVKYNATWIIPTRRILYWDAYLELLDGPNCHTLDVCWKLYKSLHDLYSPLPSLLIISVCTLTNQHIYFLVVTILITNMDAVVVLCHFCETHGPAVIMCTQPLRQVTCPLPPSRKTSTGATPLASSSCGSFHVTSTSASHEGTIWSGDHNALCK